MTTTTTTTRREQKVLVSSFDLLVHATAAALSRGDRSCCTHWLPLHDDCRLSESEIIAALGDDCLFCGVFNKLDDAIHACSLRRVTNKTQIMQLRVVGKKKRKKKGLELRCRMFDVQ